MPFTDVYPNGNRAGRRIPALHLAGAWPEACTNPEAGGDEFMSCMAQMGHQANLCESEGRLGFIKTNGFRTAPASRSSQNSGRLTWNRHATGFSPWHRKGHRTIRTGSRFQCTLLVGFPEHPPQHGGSVSSCFSATYYGVYLWSVKAVGRDSWRMRRRLPSGLRRGSALLNSLPSTDG